MQSGATWASSTSAVGADRRDAGEAAVEFGDDQTLAGIGDRASGRFRGLVGEPAVEQAAVVAAVARSKARQWTDAAAPRSPCVRGPGRPQARRSHPM